MRVLSSGRLPSESEILRLADALSCVVGTREEEAVRKLLSQLAEVRRDWLMTQERVQWFIYILQLILACPRLLLGIKGLEWVVHDLVWVLHHRKLSEDVDRDFWTAFGKVRNGLRRGRPAKIGRDLLRALLVEGYSNPPKELQGIAFKSTRSEAVSKVADLDGVGKDIRPVWRSLGKTNQYLENVLQIVKLAREEEQPEATEAQDGKQKVMQAKPTEGKRNGSRKSSVRPVHSRLKSKPTRG